MTVLLYLAIALVIVIWSVILIGEPIYYWHCYQSSKKIAAHTAAVKRLKREELDSLLSEVY